jgi:hypothetical protein
MKSHTRRAVAYIAGRLAAQVASNSVFDYSESSHFPFSGQIDNETVSVYDHSESCHVGGTLPGLYHYGNSAHITLQLASNQFTGFDYDTSGHFSGTINSRVVSLFDYEESQYFTYSV